MENKNKFIQFVKLVLYWVAPWVLILIIGFLILPKCGYKFDLKKTVKLQAEKVGLGFKDSRSAVSLTQEYPAVDGKKGDGSDKKGTVLDIK